MFQFQPHMMAAQNHIKSGLKVQATAEDCAQSHVQLLPPSWRMCQGSSRPAVSSSVFGPLGADLLLVVSEETEETQHEQRGALCLHRLMDEKEEQTTFTRIWPPQRRQGSRLKKIQLLLKTFKIKPTFQSCFFPNKLMLWAE